LTDKVHKLTIPTGPIQTASSAASTPSLPPKVLGSLSSWFGWQLAGASTTQDELAAGCNKLPSIGGDRWAAIGLVPASIKGSLISLHDEDLL